MESQKGGTRCVHTSPSPLFALAGVARDAEAGNRCLARATVAVCVGSLGPHVIMLFFNADNVQYFLSACSPTRV